MDVLAMDAAQAAALRAATAGAACRLEPVAVAAGALEGRFVLPARVLAEPAFAGLGEMLAGLEAAVVDPAEAWPEAE